MMQKNWPGARLAMLALMTLVLAACQTSTTRYGGVGASDLGAAHIMQIRRAAGLAPLVRDARLEQAAITQAAYMAATGKMKHTTGFGRDFATRMRKEGVAAPAAENLARGRMEPPRLFAMWMASSGHRSNMLEPDFSRYGLAYAADGRGQRYWALVLGR